jgi:hypothetical protein
MKFILASLLLFATCQSGLTIDSSTPEYLAVVQQKIPGNIVSDDSSPGKEPVHHFKRSIYVLLPANKLLVIDSISWNGQPLLFEMAKLASTDQPHKLGTSMPGNKMIQLKSAASKTWWMIQLADENEALGITEKLAVPVKIHVGNNTWIIEKEAAIAPAETY